MLNILMVLVLQWMEVTVIVFKMKLKIVFNNGKTKSFEWENNGNYRFDIKGNFLVISKDCKQYPFNLDKIKYWELIEWFG